MDTATPSSSAIVFGEVRAKVGLPAVAAGLPKEDELLSVAPVNALSRNRAEVATMTGESGFNMAATGLPDPGAQSVAEMHRHFSWRKKAGHLLTPVVDQGTCGCCWAVAAASVLSDRIAVRTKQNPALPFQVLMGCVDSCTLCGPCDVQLAFDLMQNQGLGGSGGAHDSGKGADPAVDDKLKAWNLPTGRTSTHSTSSVTGGGLLPTSEAADGRVHDASASRPKGLCERVKKLLSPPGSHVWKVARSTKRSPSILELQHAILRDGPAVTIMRVYTDFIVGSDPRLGEPFAGTEGVYVHSEGKTNYGVPVKHNADLGTHCMAIVGWGQTESGLRYWEIRNSWSTRWGDEGYCKVAMTEPSLGNSSVGVDLPIVTSRGGVKEANYGNLWAIPLFGGHSKGVYGSPFRGAAVGAGTAPPALAASTRSSSFFVFLALLFLLLGLAVVCAGACSGSA